MKKTLSIILSICMLLSITAGLNVSAYALNSSGSCGANVTYSFNSSTGQLTIKGSGSMTNYVNGNSPFDGNTEIKNVIINSGVTTIGAGAFSDCQNISSLSIPNTVTSIGLAAFFGCYSLSELVIPSSVKDIGLGAFGSCVFLHSISVDSANTVFDSRGNCNAIIKKSNNELVAGCMDTVIPNTVVSIGEHAFNNCYFLRKIDVPSSVTKIGECAFFGCSISNITLPSSVASIGNKAFDMNGALSSITIENKSCTIYANEETIDANAVIYGYKNSTAYQYAQKYNRQFVAIDDETKPTGSISSTNNIADKQEVTLALRDNKGIAGYYWGENSDFLLNTYTETTSGSVKITVSDIGKYYFTVKDTSGNVSDTYSTTFYMTTLVANGGTVSVENILTMSGKSIVLPTPKRSGYEYKGWSKSSDAEEGVNSITPNDNSIYFAIWEKEHTYGVGTVVTEPTCTTEGLKEYVCTDCGKTKQEKIPSKGHKSVVLKAVPATFNANGKTAGKKCSVCGKVIVAQRAVAKLVSPKLSKVTKAKKGFTAKWGKVNVDGYEIRYSLKKNMKSSKTVNVAKTATSKKVTKLKAKKTYYVQIRGYKYINGKKVYSPWSAKKKVKTK